MDQWRSSQCVKKVDHAAESNLSFGPLVSFESRTATAAAAQLISTQFGMVGVLRLDLIQPLFWTSRSIIRPPRWCGAINPYSPINRGTTRAGGLDRGWQQTGEFSRCATRYEVLAAAFAAFL
jgi:hypothetical protein